MTTKNDTLDDEKKHGLMLGQIGSLVEEFCEGEDTTLLGVQRMKAELDLRRAAGTFRKLYGKESLVVAQHILYEELSGT